MQKPIRSLVSTAVLSVLASASVQAGGFSLYTEGNGQGIGNFGAGIAAEAADASIGWYNPAGLVLIRDEQAVFGGVVILPSTKVSGTSTYSTNAFPDYVQTFSNLQAAKNAFVPSSHFALPLGENATFGFSVVAPFGLATEYSQTSPVRYAATFTELLTVNASPELGARITDNVSIGAGLDIQYAQVKFNRMIGSPAILAVADGNPALWDSESYNRGHSFGVGFHAGILGMFNDNHTRIGLNYQSRMKHKFHGYSRLTGLLADLPLLDNPNASFTTGNLFSNPIELPNLVTLSAYQDINDKLAVLGSVVYTGWGSLNSVQLNNVAAPSPLLNANIAVKSASSFNYRNAWRAAIGANYHVNEQFMLRTGVGYDQTPTNDIDRDVRLPDEDRVALSVGGHYDYSKKIGLDFGYTYLFAPTDPRINKTELIGATSRYNVNARAKAHASLLGAQVVWHIDQPAVVATK